MIFSFLLISGFSHAAPEIINANAVIYKTVEDITLKLHVYNPKKFDEQKIHNAIILFHGGGWNNGNHKAFKRQSMYFASREMVAISAEYRLKNTHGTSPYDAVEDATINPQIGRMILQFCANLTAKAKSKKIDPVIGRETEIEEMFKERFPIHFDKMERKKGCKYFFQNNYYLNHYLKNLH